MKIAIAQTDVVQGDFEKNLEKTKSFAKRAKNGGAEIAVFPEMFLCGFNYKKNLEFLKADGDRADAFEGKRQAHSGRPDHGAAPAFRIEVSGTLCGTEHAECRLRVADTFETSGLW